jgi:CHAD domain-containing protein
VEISCERATSLRDEIIVVPGEWTRHSLRKELESWLEKYNCQKRATSRKGHEVIVAPIAILHEALREKQLRSRKRPPAAPQLIDA